LRDLARALPRPEGLTAQANQRLDLWSGRLGGALGLSVARRRAGFERAQAGLRAEVLRGLILRRGERLADQGRALDAARDRRDERRADRLDALAARLVPALRRVVGDAARAVADRRERLDGLADRMDSAMTRRQHLISDRLDGLDRMRLTLGYAETLERGFAIVRDTEGQVMTTRVAAEAAQALEIEFRDGRLSLGSKAERKATGKPPPAQGTLF
jgi:exodeoxyribonuclease VII large subunit